MKRTKLNKVSKREIPKLKRKLSKLFKAWIRNRDGVMCISCGSSRANQAGHYVPDGRTGMTRWHYRNVHSQCLTCNLTDYGNTTAYGKEIDRRYGKGYAEYLWKIARRNIYQDEVETIQTLIEALQNNEDYPKVYEKTMKKYIIT